MFVKVKMRSFRTKRLFCEQNPVKLDLFGMIYLSASQYRGTEGFKFVMYHENSSERNVVESMAKSCKKLCRTAAQFNYI